MRKYAGLTILGAVVGAGLIAGLPGARSAPPQGSALITGVPHVVQKQDFCGEACAAMYLAKLGRHFSQDMVFNMTGLDPALGRGAYTAELARALKKIGFSTGPVWYLVPPRPTEVRKQWAALLADLRAGVPSIVCMHYDDRPGTTEHFRLVLGYDTRRRQVIYHEPAEAGGAYRRMALSTFLRLWPLKYSPRRWTVIRMRLRPGRLRKPPRAAGRFTDADFAQHVMRLRRRLPHQGFSIVVQKPFVVVGDEEPSMVRRRARGTVKWAVDHLKASYFARDPLRIIDIWLFKDRRSYETYTRKLFGFRPHTPYGFYSPRNRALVMNIATGGGTLVHEIVHPFMEANFPRTPAWFNEGLGSLYEQSAERHGRIWGLTNWRLRGLQAEIRAGTLPSFKALLTGGDDAFYEGRSGDNYAQARYLCYYLQLRGLLRRYYREFHANATRDPSGLATLRRVLGERDLRAFQRRWQRFVMGLRFP